MFSVFVSFPFLTPHSLPTTLCFLFPSPIFDNLHVSSFHLSSPIVKTIVKTKTMSNSRTHIPRDDGGEFTIIRISHPRSLYKFMGLSPLLELFLLFLCINLWVYCLCPYFPNFLFYTYNIVDIDSGFALFFFFLILKATFSSQEGDVQATTKSIIACLLKIVTQLGNNLYVTFFLCVCFYNVLLLFFLDSLCFMWLVWLTIYVGVVMICTRNSKWLNCFGFRFLLFARAYGVLKGLSFLVLIGCSLL